MPKISLSKEFLLFHQIAFSETPEAYTPNRDSCELIKNVGVENYKLWTLSDTREFLQNEYGSDVLKTFDTLIPFAYKADLARYCIVNKFGGTYLDVNVGRLKQFDIENHEMVLFTDENSSRTSWKIQNGFFYSKPNSLILQDSIEEIVRNVSNKHYGFDAHFVSGPSVLGRSVALHGLEVDLLVGKYFWLKNRRNKYVLPNGDVVARNKRGGAYLGGNSGVNGGNNYNEIWKSGHVYGEQQIVLGEP